MPVNAAVLDSLEAAREIIPVLSFLEGPHFGPHKTVWFGAALFDRDSLDSRQALVVDNSTLAEDWTEAYVPWMSYPDLNEPSVALHAARPSAQRACADSFPASRHDPSIVALNAELLAEVLEEVDEMWRRYHARRDKARELAGWFDSEMRKPSPSMKKSSGKVFLARLGIYSVYSGYGSNELPSSFFIYRPKQKSPWVLSHKPSGRAVLGGFDTAAGAARVARILGNEWNGWDNVLSGRGAPKEIQEFTQLVDVLYGRWLNGLDDDDE